MLYVWLSSIPSITPKNITRDFADGTLVAKLIHTFIPKIVQLHNYAPANSVAQRLYNYTTLNARVFKKMGGWSVGSELVDGIVRCKAGYAEVLLFEIWKRVDAYIHRFRAVEPVQVERVGVAKNHGANAVPVMIPVNRLQMQGLPALAAKKAVGPSRALESANQGDKDRLIYEMRETIGTLGVKINKLEMLLSLKDRKIEEFVELMKKNGTIQ